MQEGLPGGEVVIVDYEDRFAPAFARLNTAWLEEFGLLEPADEKQLHQPRTSIIERGGHILCALEGDMVVGTCAILALGPCVAELAKLAVARAAQGRGIGRKLVLAALDRVRALGATRVILVSNSKLNAAIRLYESLGFVHRPLPQDIDYATADVYMELDLAAQESAGP